LKRWPLLVYRCTERKSCARSISCKPSRVVEGLGGGEFRMKDWSNAPWVDPSLGWKLVTELPERALIDFVHQVHLC